jgi:hypothetical protein
MYVCLCNGITERQVRECARRGASSLEQLGVELGVGMASWLGPWQPPPAGGPAPPRERGSLPLTYHPVPDIA